MNAHEFGAILAKAFRDWYKNPAVILPSLAALLILTLLSKLTLPLTLSFTTDKEHIIWLAISSPVFLAIISLFFAALLVMCFAILKKRRLSYSLVSQGAFRAWPRNFINTLIISFCSMMAFILSLLTGKLLVSVNFQLSIIGFLLVMFAALAGGIIFLTFTNIYTITHNFSVLKSIKASISLVKKEYVPVLSLIVILYVINALLTRLAPDLIAELVKSVFIVPYLAFILVHLVLAES